MKCFRCFRSNKWQEDFILCLSVSLQLLKYSSPPPPHTHTLTLKVTLISWSLNQQHGFEMSPWKTNQKSTIYYIQLWGFVCFFNWEDHSVVSGAFVGYWQNCCTMKDQNNWNFPYAHGWWLSYQDRVSANLRTGAPVTYGALFETFLQVCVCQCIQVVSRALDHVHPHRLPPRLPRIPPSLLWFLPSFHNLTCVFENHRVQLAPSMCAWVWAPPRESGSPSAASTVGSSSPRGGASGAPPTSHRPSELAWSCTGNHCFLVSKCAAAMLWPETAARSVLTSFPPSLPCILIQSCCYSTSGSIFPDKHYCSKWGSSTEFRALMSFVTAGLAHSALWKLGLSRAVPDWFPVSCGVSASGCCCRAVAGS